jgi:hypothetical protein
MQEHQTADPELRSHLLSRRVFQFMALLRVKGFCRLTHGASPNLTNGLQSASPRWLISTETPSRHLRPGVYAKGNTSVNTNPKTCQD